MMQNRQITAGALVLAAALAVVGPAAAQPADPITLRTIARLVDQAMPHVNAVLNPGVPNAAPIVVPKLVFVSKAEFRKLPDPETDFAVRARLPELSARNLERAQESARNALAEVTLARYRPGADCIVIALPLDEHRVASWSTTAMPDPPELAAQRTLQLAIVHEIVRQHLDKQCHWWDQLAKCRDEDELRTWQALIEGRSLQATEAVADKLGSFAYAGLLAQRYRSVPDMGPDPDRLAIVRPVVFRQKFDAATNGKEFFARLVREGVTPGEAFANPPRQLLWVTRPELYVKSLRGGPPDLRKVLAGLERFPPGAQATAAQQALGPDMVREVATMLQEQARAEAVLKGWEEGRTLAWFAPSAAGSIAISIARFDTPASARAYHGLTLDLQRKRDELMNSNCTAGCKVIESKCEAVEMPRADTAARCLKKVQYSGGHTVAAEMLYVLVGSLVIEVNGFSAPVDPTWARQVVANIVSDFAAAQVAVPGAAR